MSKQGQRSTGPTFPDADAEALESACEESQRVLDHQLSVQEDIDDKAIWTVRTAILVLGLLLSAGSLGNLTAFLNLPWYVHGLTGVGVSLLLFSVVFGIATYTMTQTYPGVSRPQTAKAYRGDYDYEQWQSELLLNYRLSITGQEAWNEYNGLYLFITHVLLLTGTTAIVIAGILSLFLTYDSNNGAALVGGLLLPVVAVAVMVLLLWKG